MYYFSLNIWIYLAEKYIFNAGFKIDITFSKLQIFEKITYYHY